MWKLLSNSTKSLPAAGPSMNLEIVPKNLVFPMSVFLFLLIHFSHNSNKKSFQKKCEPMGTPINWWNTLFTNLKKQLPSRNFTLCLRTAFVNTTQDSLSYVVHLAPYLSPVVKLPLIALKQNSVSSRNTLDNSLWGIFMYKVEISKDKIEATVVLLFILSIPFMTDLLLKTLEGVDRWKTSRLVVAAFSLVESYLKDRSYRFRKWF